LRFNYFKKIIILVFLILNVSFVLANSAPINSDSNLLIPDNEIQQNKNEIKTINVSKINKKETPLYYLSKQEEKSKINNEKKISQNIEVINPQTDRIISQSTRKINAIYPTDAVNPLNTYPGYRGPNQLVIYTREFGKTTGTNEFGKEAVVIDGVVSALTGANSNIPNHNGYVISGHGSAKKWISDNLKIGTKIEIEDRTIKAYTTIDSYRYFAKTKIKAVEEILVSTKYDYMSRDDKLIYNHLKKAKQQYKKSLKDNSDNALNCAKESIENASIAFRYTLPYIKNELKGVWIRPNEKNISDIQKTLDKMQSAGINNVFIETFYHGRTIFPSRIMKEYGFEEQNPDFQGTDILAIWLNEAHKRNIKVHCWFESFYIGNKSPDLNSKSILAIKPSWMNRNKQKADYEGWVSHSQEHNGYFLDPANPEVTTFLLKLIGEISAKYNIDGFNVDYVRYPNIAKENYSNQWGYTKYAREEFISIYEIDPIELNKNSDLWENWCDYRSEKITSYIKKVSELLKNRNIMFSAVIFPDYKVSLKTKFQDWTNWAQNDYVDAFTPLILTSDDDLSKSMLEDIKRKSDNVKIYPGLFAGFIESDPEDLLRQIHIVRRLKMKGVILFDWAHLSDNYINVLKTSVFKSQTN